MNHQFLLNDFIIEKHVKNALEEDIGYGDITTDFLYSDSEFLTAYLNTRADGVICGLPVFRKVFRILSKDVRIDFEVQEGEKIQKGQTLAKIIGPARAILTGERTALNYIQRMSGIATETAKYQEAIKPYSAFIVDTRKNTPGFRLFEKYSVAVGGGKLHRFNLSDCAMVKDNHIKHAGSITNAVQSLRKNGSHAHKIEVECDTFEQVKEAVENKADIIMLDNMNVEDMKKCVDFIAKRAIVEASGNVKLDTVNKIASSGVDIISTSAIVANAPVLDLGLDM